MLDAAEEDDFDINIEVFFKSAEMDMKEEVRSDRERKYFGRISVKKESC